MVIASLSQYSEDLGSGLVVQGHPMILSETYQQTMKSWSFPESLNMGSFHSFFLCFVFVFKTEFHYVVQAGHKL